MTPNDGTEKGATPDGGLDGGHRGLRAVGDEEQRAVGAEEEVRVVGLRDAGVHGDDEEAVRLVLAPGRAVDLWGPKQNWVVDIWRLYFSGLAHVKMKKATCVVMHKNAKSAYVGCAPQACRCCWHKCVRQRACVSVHALVCTRPLSLSSVL